MQFILESSGKIYVLHNPTPALQLTIPLLSSLISCVSMCVCVLSQNEWDLLLLPNPIPSPQPIDTIRHGTGRPKLIDPVASFP